MSDETKRVGLPRDHVRIESTLDWFFNYADGDLGLTSAYGAMVAALANPKGHAEPSADAAEDRLHKAAEAVRRYRAVATVLRRMSPRDQRDLCHAYTNRRWARELTPRPAQQRWLAATSPAVRAYLEGRGTKEWKLPRAEALLAKAQRATKGPDLAELVALRVEAWLWAERELEGLLTRYAEAQAAVANDEAAERVARPSRGGREARPS